MPDASFSHHTPILITGGSGFIGQHVQAYFKRCGYRVFAPRHAELELLDVQAVHAFLKQHDIEHIVHAASRGATPEARMADNVLIQHNVVIFENLVTGLNNKGTLINLGSGAEYGKHRDIRNVRESEDGLFIPQDAYGQAKFTIQQRITALPNAINLRLFGVFGPGEDPSYRFISYVIRQARQNAPVRMKQDARFSYLWVHDIGPIVETLFQQPEPAIRKALNAVPDDSITLLEIVAHIETLLGTSIDLSIQTPGLNREYTGCNDALKTLYSTIALTPTRRGIEWLCTETQ
jgi:nucleoside-diphosphate-sugar epimerase